MISTPPKNPVLVLGGDFTGLWITRDLGKRGIDVHVVANSNADIAFKGKFCKNKFILPKPWSCKNLKKILKLTAKATTKRLVIYPITDVTALNLSRVKDELPDDYFFMVADRNATETLVNKSKFYKALSKNQIEYPKTFFPEDLQSAKHIGKDLNYPVFIRPSITQLFTNVFGNRKGFVVKNFEELLKYYDLALSKNVEVMFQEIVSGPAESSIQLEGYFNKQFCSTGLFVRQRLRIWPPDFGNTTLCVSLPLSDFTYESNKITDFMKKIKYNGLASAEFKKDEKDKEYKLLEINARPWYHIWLSAKCGCDILFSSYLDAVGKKAICKKHYVIGIKSIHLYNDRLASIDLIKKRELTFRGWLSSLKGVKQSTLFDKNDTFPFFSSYMKRYLLFLTQRPKQVVSIFTKNRNNTTKQNKLAENSRN